MDLIKAPEDLGAFASALWTWLVEFLPHLGSALLIFIVGYLIAAWAARGVAGLARRTSRVDPTVHPILAATVRYSILVLVIIAALAQLGVQTTSLLAVLGAAGLAIGLALQGTLSNIAAGLMILWLRPFSAGDEIETADVAGTVEQLGLFHTQIRTFDGIYKFVPNSQLWNVILTNYTRNPTRMIHLDVGIAYEADMAEGRRVLEKTARAHPGVLDEPPPTVVPLKFGESAVLLQLRAWARTPDFWGVRWDLTENAKRELEAAGIAIPYPQRTLHVADNAVPPEHRKRCFQATALSSVDGA